MSAIRVGLDDFNTIPETPPEITDDSAFTLNVDTTRTISQIPDPGDDDLLLGPLVIRGGRSIIVGDTGHGKTTLALQMAAGILTGDEVLGYEGAGQGPILIIDLEQGLRSIKRTIRQAGLEDQEEALYVRQPDGLALDSDINHLAELHRIIGIHRPTVVVLDPFYKAHRGDANEERAIVDLMRVLDALRDKYGFALILPAHPRKELAGTNGIRKLTIHDVAGSAAVTRGAEIVLGVERGAQGYARLRILKDRDSDLPVGEAWDLIFTPEDGFRLDPKQEIQIEDIETLILAEPGNWHTIKEWAGLVKGRQKTVRNVLDRLADAGKAERVKGPPGRHKTAVCWRALKPGETPSIKVIPTAPETPEHLNTEGVPTTREHPGTPTPADLDLEGVPAVPASIGRRGSGNTSTGVPDNGNTSENGTPPDEDFPW